MSPRRRLVVVVVLAAAVIVAGVAHRPTPPPPQVWRRSPTGIMGTSCALTAVLPRGVAGEPALAAAEAELRRCEAVLSTWRETSAVSQLNRAPAGPAGAVAPDLLAVLQAAATAHQATDRAFDVTCRPLLELWRQSARQDRLPTDAALAAARVASSWTDLVVTPAAVEKRRASVQVDLGGIAKGYAIDRAVAAMRAAGAVGGLVDVGGDLRCFGPAPGGDRWQVGLQNPAGDDLADVLRVGDTAVCTSGDYRRYQTVEGRRYSHIIDPRTGWPATAARSATVLAADALTADIWATALSILGEAGLDHLPSGGEALLLIDEGSGLRRVATPGFATRVEAEVGAATR